MRDELWQHGQDVQQLRADERAYARGDQHIDEHVDIERKTLHREDAPEHGRHGSDHHHQPV